MSAGKRCPGSSSHGGNTDPLPVESLNVEISLSMSEQDNLS